MFTAATTVTMLSLCALFVSLQAFDVQGVSTVETLSAFALVRVVVALSPLPGGVGLAEISLVTLLTNAGADEVLALGATLLYRCVVWLTPLVVGGLGWWTWSRRHLWTRDASPRLDDGLIAEGAIPLKTECRRCHRSTTSREDSSHSLATNP